MDRNCRFAFSLNERKQQCHVEKDVILIILGFIILLINDYRLLL